MITVDAVATAAMVRFGSDAELDVTVYKWKEKKKKKPNKQMSKELKYYFKRILKIKWVEKRRWRREK